MGSLATEKPGEGQIISGVLVKRNFKYQIVAPSDISSNQHFSFAHSSEDLFSVINSLLYSEYTDMTVNNVTQRMGVHYGGSIETLQAVLTHVSPDVVVSGGDKKMFRLFSAIDVIVERTLVTLEVLVCFFLTHFLYLFILIFFHFFSGQPVPLMICSPTRFYRPFSNVKRCLVPRVFRV